MPDLTLVPTADLRLVLDANASRASGSAAETHALERLRIALEGRGGCTDLRGSTRECCTCRVPECPHGHQGDI